MSLSSLQIQDVLLEGRFCCDPSLVSGSGQIEDAGFEFHRGRVTALDVRLQRVPGLLQAVETLRDLMQCGDFPLCKRFVVVREGESLVALPRWPS